MNKKIKFKYQLNANDCGIACVQMICQFYGKEYNINTIKKYCEVSKLGTSIKDIRSFFDLIGIDSHSVNIPINDIWDMPLPAILYFKKGHYVLLEKISRKKEEVFFHIIDPSFGKIRISQENLLEKWYSGNSGLAIITNPNDKFLLNSLEENTQKNFSFVRNDPQP